MTSTLSLMQPAHEAARSLAALMATYPCYAYVGKADGTGARALFRGRWDWDQVAAYLPAEPHKAVVDDERASGYLRCRLYHVGDLGPVCVAEIEVYLARGGRRTTFWCEAEDARGALAMAA
ncbi:MAG: hypothetical protein VKQ33_12050 [Candidatus Sericytochromatia bacterium]|nr:hypothetical protein [Candidatus Sericytochromatia bacterium]